MPIFGASWRTSLGGVMSILAGIIAAYNGQWTEAGLAFSTAWVALNARDNVVSSEQAKAAPSGIIPPIIAKP